ncbi:MAG: hypothetical protein WA091_01075 [Minisyncoccales bacterium]
MKKIHIILISIIAIAVLVVGGIYLFQGNKNTDQFSDQEIPGNQDVTELSIDSLSLGNWASIVAEKGDDGIYIADMISVCESEDSCSAQQGGNGQTSPSGTGTPTGEAPTGTGTAPSGSAPSGDKTSGTAPTGTAPSGEGQKDMSNKSMLSGTIIEIGENSITLELDTGETATVAISDSTRVVER